MTDKSFSAFLLQPNDLFCDRVDVCSDGSLTCPRCQDKHASYLHHDGVIVYCRNEDDPLTVVTRVGITGTSSVVPSQSCGNPSGRRTGVVIHFDCEICGGHFRLTIAQHKGMTYLHWKEGFYDRGK